jgi:uncharacterized protein
MRPEEIAAYLKDHPEFFEQYADFLSQLHIPSPHGGRAISITERQMTTLREKVKTLEGKLAELIGFGEENDATAEKVHRLAMALLSAEDLQSVMRFLYAHLGGSFAVPHVAVRLWGVGGGDDAEYQPVVDAVKVYAGGSRHPYCGTSAGQATLEWFGERGGHIHSMAQIPLREGGLQGGACFGLMVLASEDPHRFYADMGTLYLERIGDLAAAALLRVVH